ncbi:MAG: hypothetical protein ACK2TV_04035, partial [Anaerolineales bacterium]
MKTRIQLIGITSVIILLFITVVPKQVGFAETSLNSSDQNQIFLPIISKEYAWKNLVKWTPWALAGQSVRELYTGPIQGWVWSITQEGTFRSMDYGFSWEKIDENLDFTPILFAIKNSPESESPIFAATYGGLIYISIDHGTEWSLDKKFENYPYPVYLDYVEDTVYFATYNPSQVYQRSSSGEWEAVGSELSSPVNEIAVFHTNLYVVNNDGLYKLTGDAWETVNVTPYPITSFGPQSWTTSFQGIQSGPEFYFDTSALLINSIHVDGDTFYVGTQNGRGVYRSNDGIHWTAVDVGITDPYYPSVNEIVGSQSGRLFLAAGDGVFVSENGGERWQNLDMNLPHTNTGYGILLDNFRPSSVTLLRDDGDEQTLAATFYEEGIWLLTVTSDMLLNDRPSQTPPKAVLVVGPVDPPDHNATKSYIESANRLANIMASNGMAVKTVYWPESTWENVREAISGASIIVYKGHGFGIGDMPSDPTEMYGGLNGFCLVNPLDSWGARLGTQDMLVTTNQLAENAIGFFFCCYCAGHSSS